MVLKVIVLIFGVIAALFLGDFLWSVHPSEGKPTVTEFADGDGELQIPFMHQLHGDSIGLDCAACHSGARMGAFAQMPSKKDCMDCHRLPLTESENIEKLDSVLSLAKEHPWKRNRILPEHVVFHHGVHSAAGVSCEACHVFSPEKKRFIGLYDMNSCLKCHKGETLNGKTFKAATYCAACHR